MSIQQTKAAAIVGSPMAFHRLGTPSGLLLLALVLTATGLFAAGRWPFSGSSLPQPGPAATTPSPNGDPNAAAAAADDTGKAAESLSVATMVAAARRMTGRATVEVSADRAALSGNNLVVDVTIKNRAKETADGLLYGVAVYWTEEANERIVESHEGIMAALKQGSTPEGIGTTYKAKHSTKKQLTFAAPAEPGHFTQAHVAVTTQGGPIPIILPVALESRASRP